MDFNSEIRPDYMNINQKRLDINPINACTTYTGETLTQQESLFIHYIVCGMAKIQAYIKAGFLLDTKQSSAKSKDGRIQSSVDKTLKSHIDNIRNNKDIYTNAEVDTPQLETTETIPAAAEKEKERNDLQILLDKQTIQTLMKEPSAENLAKLPPQIYDTLTSASWNLANNQKIQREFLHRLDLLKDAQTAQEHEIYAYLTAVMRGQVKDQFGLDPSLQERTRAAEALAKRVIDAPRKTEAMMQAYQGAPVKLVIKDRKQPVIDADFTEVN